jgi:hypothetical protein
MSSSEILGHIGLQFQRQLPPDNGTHRPGGQATLSIGEREERTLPPVFKSEPPPDKD